MSLGLRASAGRRGGGAVWNDRAAGVPWSRAGGSYAVEVGSFTPVGEARVAVDLTTVVQGWVDGTRANHGLLLRIDGPDGQLNTPSRENGGFAGPTLVVAYQKGSAVI